ncbi:MAG: polyribonucleotide nucleotidyltransferase [Thermoanaerobaculaceae bacterium]|nr:polyribonucleotide nucleotidyltransferase [Thermoanaerobaculaceae bacterium]MDI9620911.1 polyribonucleotide nucleotidyltransferase [Acidobacteriota bacterium]NLH10181.1 polyribonucleotide nucleotidyltransferase [Holophagae bacterium]HPW56797.1 polyribonucleotide nucleotidyltransferase [Thermoanaerobaculaceae bacterium]
MEVIEKVDIQGRSLSFETGKLAKQADGACLVRFGETLVLVTACYRKDAREGVDFLPLTVDYRENTYAGGRIPGGWFKREGRPTEKEILTSRLIDRPLRPLFPDGFTQETQIVGTVLSADGVNDPDVLAINGASLALVLSDAPFDNPIAAVRIGLCGEELVVNPTHQQRADARLDIIVAGTSEAVVMVEAGATGVTEAQVLDAIDLAHREIKPLIAAQRALQARAGRPKVAFAAPATPWPAELEADLRQRFQAPLDAALRVRGKLNQYAAIDRVIESALASLPDDERAARSGWVKTILLDMVRVQFRRAVLEGRERLDGRAFDQVRTVTCEVGLLPRTHGSALFTRGETQALVTCTLGTSEDVQIIEALEGETQHRFLLHYNFPPFSVGEVKFLRGPGRREIGHGNLARRALMPVIPDKNAFPYTLRVVSDILESNGSSSMATVCGGTLSLMDAGVPISAPVAGVAMGLVSDGQRFAVLTDIAGQEDHEGDMDFKVAGTRDGITALQMDIKIAGLSRPIMEQALEQARQGRLHLLDIMEATIAAPRTEISSYAPRIISIHIDPDKIRDVIGPGGKTIRAICEQTGARINIEDDGQVEIATSDEAAAENAVRIIEGLTREPQIGEVFEGTVKRVEAYGAFVEILPNKDGLLHVSEIAHERTREVSDVLKLGDKIQVKIIGIDQNDRIKLSRRALLPVPEGFSAEPEGEHRPRRHDEGRGDHNRTDRGHGDRHHGGDRHHRPR